MPSALQKKSGGCIDGTAVKFFGFVAATFCASDYADHNNNDHYLQKATIRLEMTENFDMSLKYLAGKSSETP